MQFGVALEIAATALMHGFMEKNRDKDVVAFLDELT